MVEGILNDDAKFIAYGLFLAQSSETTVVGLEAPAVGPQGEEQHAGIPLFDRGEFLVRRSAVGEELPVGVRAFGVIDMCQRADPLEQGGFVRPACPGLESRLSTQPGPVFVALENVAEFQSGLVQKVRQ